MSYIEFLQKVFIRRVCEGKHQIGYPTLGRKIWWLPANTWTNDAAS